MRASNQILCLTMVAITWTVVSSTSVDRRSVATTNSKNIRGSKVRGAPGNKKKRDQNRRNAKGIGHPGHHNPSYTGCFNYTDDEMEDMWIFSASEAPNCTYVYYNVTEDASDGGDNYDGDNEGDGSEDSGNGDDDNDGTEGGDDSDDQGQEITYEEVADGDYSPYDDFLIDHCDTYENLWMWDLSLSCEDEVTLDGCNCTFAEELLNLGLLECDDQDECPEGCPICSTCLTLLGCMSPVIRTGSRFSTSFILYIIAAAIAVLILGLGIYHSRRRSQQENEMKKGLMAGEIKKDDLYPTKPNAQLAPWEPPTDKPIQFGPSSKAATAAAGGGVCGDAKPLKEDSDSDSDASVESHDGTLPTIGETTIHMADDDTAPTIPTREETSDRD